MEPDRERESNPDPEQSYTFEVTVLELPDLIEWKPDWTTAGAVLMVLGCAGLAWYGEYMSTWFLVLAGLIGGAVLLFVLGPSELVKCTSCGERMRKRSISSLSMLGRRAHSLLAAGEIGKLLETALYSSDEVVVLNAYECRWCAQSEHVVLELESMHEEEVNLGIDRRKQRVIGRSFFRYPAEVIDILDEQLSRR